MNALSNPRLRLFVGATMISFSPVWVKLVSVSPTTSGFYRVCIGGVALALVHPPLALATAILLFVSLLYHTVTAPPLEISA